MVLTEVRELVEGRAGRESPHFTPSHWPPTTEHLHFPSVGSLVEGRVQALESGHIPFTCSAGRHPGPVLYPASYAGVMVGAEKAYIRSLLLPSWGCWEVM